MDEEKKPKKDKECILCEFIFECRGKPEGVRRCIGFKKRVDKQKR